MDRRTAIKVITSASTGALLTACAPIAPASAPTAKPQAATPRSGGTIVYGGLDDITAVDGHVTSSPAYDTLYQVFDRLAEYDIHQQPQPRLAESWDISADGKQIKLNLRKGVQYHNGRELVSDDIKWNILRVRQPSIASGLLPTQSAWFTSIDTPDKYTVVLGSEQPRPAVFDFFEYLNIVDPSSASPTERSNKPIGTGPFAFVEWVQGDHFSTVKHKSYWQSGRPYADAFQMQVFRDPAAMMTQLETGVLDLVKSPPAHDFARIKADPAYQALLEPEGRFYYLGANMKMKPLDDKRVRQALAYTLDRKRFVDTVSLGIGTAQSCPWPSFSPAYEASKANAYSFDLDKARALLKDAGVSNLQLEIWPVSLYPELQDFAQIHQADLDKIGVKLTIRNADLASWVDTVVNQKYQGLYSTAFGTAQLFPSTLMSGAAYNPKANNSAFTSDAYTKLVDTMTAEPDAAKRKLLYSQLNDLLNDEAFVYPIATAPFRVAARSSLHNVEFLLHDAVTVVNSWKEA
jgi:peptide/nickel transport system substrate-binding protein